jgi:TrmH family RNA methyltransferase
MRTVSSRHNPAVRAFRELAGEGGAAGLRILLDGAHLVHEALESGAAFEIAAVASSRLTSATAEQQLAETLECRGVDVIAVPDHVFSAISPVRTPSGIAAIVRRTLAGADGICRHPEAFILVPVGVQDPGNVGALLRAAEAGGATGALVCASPLGAAADPFSWKALRGSMGSALRLPVAAGLDVVDALDRLRAAGVRTVAAVARKGQDPDAVNWSGPVALILGGEGPGLPHEITARCDDRVTIPMTPAVESLNVAVAGGILIYAARRQRVQPPASSRLDHPTLT